MHLYVAIAFMLIYQTASVPPLRLTIDCSDETIQPFGSPFKLSSYNRKSGSGLNVNSFCNLIHNAIPEVEAVEDGMFIIIKPHADQEGFSDTHAPIAIAPPKGFIPTLRSSKWKVPNLKVPKLIIPKLETRRNSPRKAPKVGLPMKSTSSMLPIEDSSAERMEKLQKGIEKMLRFVKVLGQIDQYLSERIRIIVDKISKTFAE